MKFSLLIIKIGVFCLISFSVSNSVLAANQGNTVKLQPPPLPQAVNNKRQAAAPAPANNTQPIDQVVLQSRDISSAGPQWQLFSDYLTVPQGCDQIPFFLTFTNGSNRRADFKTCVLD